MKASPATSAPANPPIAPANAPDPTLPAVLLLLEAGFTYTSYFSKNFTITKSNDGTGFNLYSGFFVLCSLFVVL